MPTTKTGQPHKNPPPAAKAPGPHNTTTLPQTNSPSDTTPQPNDLVASRQGTPEKLPTPKTPPKKQTPGKKISLDDDPERQRQAIGEVLNQKLSTQPLANAIGINPTTRCKIIGMILQQDLSECIALLEDEKALLQKVEECNDILKSYEEHNNSEHIAEDAAIQPTDEVSQPEENNKAQQPECHHCKRPLNEAGKCTATACVVNRTSPRTNPFDEVVRKAREGPRDSKTKTRATPRNTPTRAMEVRALPGLKGTFATEMQTQLISKITNNQLLHDLPESLASFLKELPNIRSKGMRYEWWTCFEARAENVRANLLPFQENLKGLMKLLSAVNAIHTIRHPGAKTLILLRVDTSFRMAQPTFNDHDCVPVCDFSAKSKSVILDMTHMNDYTPDKPRRNTVGPMHPMTLETFSFPTAALMRPNTTLCFDPEMEKRLKTLLWEAKIRTVITVGRGKLRIHADHNQEDIIKAVSTMQDWRLYNETDWSSTSPSAGLAHVPPKPREATRHSDNTSKPPDSTFVLLVEAKSSRMLEHAVEDTGMTTDDTKYTRDCVPSFQGYALKLIKAPLPDDCKGMQILAMTPTLTFFLLPIKEALFREAHGHSPALQMEWGDKASPMPGGAPKTHTESKTPIVSTQDSSDKEEGSQKNKRNGEDRAHTEGTGHRQVTPSGTPNKPKRTKGTKFTVTGQGVTTD